MQARRFVNYRLKHCWPKFIYYICQPKKKTRGCNQKSGRDMAHPGPPLESPLPVKKQSAENVPQKCVWNVSSNCDRNKKWLLTTFAVLCVGFQLRLMQ